MAPKESLGPVWHLKRDFRPLVGQKESFGPRWCPKKVWAPKLPAALLIKIFKWRDKPLGSVLGDQAIQVQDWASRALDNNEFDQCDFRYSFKLPLRFFGVLGPDFNKGLPSKL